MGVAFVKGMTRTSPSNPVSAVPMPVWRAIKSASHRTGVDFGYMLDQARIESGFRPDARAATSSAAGLYQFTSQTWLATLKRHGAAHGHSWAAEAIGTGSGETFRIADPALRETILGLRTDPQLAALMAGELAADNHAQLADALGRQPEPVDMYLAHFLGAAGATDFLKVWAADPGQAAASLFPKAAAANRSIFYDAGGAPRSLDAIRRSFAAKLENSGGAMPVGMARQSMAAAILPAAPLELRQIEPMPQKLSLDFARDAYRRLARIGGAGA